MEHRNAEHRNGTPEHRTPEQNTRIPVFCIPVFHIPVFCSGVLHSGVLCDTRIQFESWRILQIENFLNSSLFFAIVCPLAHTPANHCMSQKSIHVISQLCVSERICTKNQPRPLIPSMNLHKESAHAIDSINHLAICKPMASQLTKNSTRHAP